MKRFLMSVTAGVCIMSAAVFTQVSAAESTFPDRPITWLVPWSAGGGTDAVSRKLASLVEQELGVPVNVINRTGGAGVVGHSAIANAKPDGYTIGTVTGELSMMHWQGLTDIDYKIYTPIALVNTDPAGLQVRADSPFKTAQDLIDAIKADPGKLKASGTSQGGIWHLALAGMLDSAGIEQSAAPWVPSKGSAPALLDLVAGGVDFVPSSIPEASALIQAGKVRALAVMGDERLAAYPDVPTLKESSNVDWAIAGWRGVAAPAGVPDDAKAKLEAAVKKAWNDPSFVSLMAGKGFGRTWADSAGFAEWLETADESFGTVLKAVGLAK